MTTNRRKPSLLALSVLLAVALLTALAPYTPVAGVIDSGTTNGWEWVTLSPTEIAIVGNAVATGNVTLPATLEIAAGDFRTVREIGSNAFSGNAAITGLTFPSTLKTIRTQAFLNCSTLTSVTFPSGLEAIGTRSFYGAGITSLDIPSTVFLLDNECFAECFDLASVAIANPNVAIGADAFRSCTDLVSVTLPDGLTTFGEGAFAQCIALERIRLPSKLTAIPARAFSMDESLEEIAIPPDVSVISEAAFESCEALVEVNLSPGLETIEAHAFEGCTLLSGIFLFDGLETIGAEAFAKCSEVEFVTIPASVDAIGSNAFFNCASLEKVTVLNPATTFGAFVFNGCLISEDGIYGFTGSTADTYATDYAFPFHAIDEYPPVLHATGPWNSYFGATLLPGQTLPLSGQVTSANDKADTFDIYGRFDGGAQTLIDTVSLDPDSEPSALSTPLGVAPVLFGDWSGSLQVPTTLGPGIHYLTLHVVSASGLESVVHYITFYIAPLDVTPSASPTIENPQTGDPDPVTPLALMLLAAGVLVFAFRVRLAKR